MVEMVPINSENIKSLGFDKSTNYLYIIFENDDMEYLYKNVQMETFIELLFSQSKNQYLEEHIFNRCEKIAV